MLDDLKQQVYDANLRLLHERLVIQTFGNVSGIDRSSGRVVIKPSGVPYAAMTPADMVVVELLAGAVVEGDLRPSSDTPTHLELYRSFPGIGGVVHSHSLHATAWAQARREIPALGTTHADHFYGAVPVTRILRPDEIETDYERNTGRVIVERFEVIDPWDRPGVLVAGHGPFAWGADADDAVHNAVILEFVARLAAETLRLAPDADPIGESLLDRHYLRKHGPEATYGQG